MISIGKNHSAAWANIENRAIYALTECDYTQQTLADRPVSEEKKLAYQPYREALREIVRLARDPQPTDLPSAVVWPTKP